MNKHFNVKEIAAALTGCGAMEAETILKTRVIPKIHKSRGNNVNLHKMKKIFAMLIAVIGFGISANAQDIIVTKEGKKIDAVVLEIELEVVKYKYFDNQNGPTISMRKSDIASIIYQNGSVEVFNTQTSTPTSYSTSDLRSEFDRIGTDDELMLIFLKKNNFQKHYNDFLSACKKRRSGANLLSVGIGLFVGGAVWVGISFIDIDNFYWMAYTGYAFMGVGHVLTIVSIPVSASAGARKKAIKNNFARENFGTSCYTYQPTLNFNFTGNGFGMTLNF